MILPSFILVDIAYMLSIVAYLFHVKMPTNSMLLRTPQMLMIHLVPAHHPFVSPLALGEGLHEFPHARPSPRSRRPCCY